MKRERARAIIYCGDKIVAMYREFQGRVFYTFPGGGMEEGETEEETVKREVLEEFGLVVKPIKKVYEYENERERSYYYICEWIGGEFGSGSGEEFSPAGKDGVYKPVMIDISAIPNLPLMPPEIAKVFYEDYIKNGQELRKNIEIVKRED